MSHICPCLLAGYGDRILMCSDGIPDADKVRLESNKLFI